MTTMITGRSLEEEGSPGGDINMDIASDKDVITVAAQGYGGIQILQVEGYKLITIQDLKPAYFYYKPNHPSKTFLFLCHH